MKNSFGNNLKITIFGESHGPAIGAVIDGLASGVKIDGDYISKKLSKRRPSGQISTARQEADNFEILSGVKNGYSCGTPICIMIRNSLQHSADYNSLNSLARPGHADYTAFLKYHGFEDRSGGGHQSGRITAAVVAAGAIIQSALESKGIYIGTHVKKCAGISDRDFDIKNLKTDIANIAFESFPVLDGNVTKAMQEKILSAKKECDSVGGITETVVLNVPRGIGEPWFDSAESMISSAMFSVPAVKGVEFGDGFAISDKKGSEANDGYKIFGGKIISETNHNGGILGGITDGSPLLFRCAVKPTPSIAKKQKTVDFEKNEDTEIEIKGRHDPCIVHRAAAVIDAMTAITIADLCVTRFGTDWLSFTGEK